MAAGFLLLAMRLGAAADPDATPGADDSSPPEGRVVILTGSDATDDSPRYFEDTVSPLVVAYAPDAAGQFGDSANENLDFGWHVPLSNLLTIGYDTDVNAFRQDQTIWDYDGADSEVTTNFVSKPSVVLQAGPALKLTDYVQAARTYSDGVPGYVDSTEYGTQAAWTPIKDVTTVTAGAGAGETYNFNHSILDQDFYSGSLSQKLPYVPFTLQTTGSYSQESAPLLAADDSRGVVAGASLLWQIVTTATCAIGVQRDDAFAPATNTLQDTDTYFTQLSVQATQSCSVTMGVAHDQNLATESGQFLSAGSDNVLSLGLNWKLGDRFNAGAGVSYRVLQSQTPAPVVNAPPATISLSAGASF
jgi:hypothetical protein